jgi:hypothetical protein
MSRKAVDEVIAKLLQKNDRWRFDPNRHAYPDRYGRTAVENPAGVFPGHGEKPS